MLCIGIQVVEHMKEGPTTQLTFLGMTLGGGLGL